MGQVYTAKLANRNCVVTFRQRNRSEAKFADESITFSDSQIHHAKQLSKKLECPAYVAAQVLVAKRWKASYIVPLDEWSKFHVGQHDFPCNEKMREKFFKEPASGFFSGLHIEIEEPAEAPPAEKKPKAKPAKKSHGGSGAAAPASVTQRRPFEKPLTDEEKAFLDREDKEPLMVAGISKTGELAATEEPAPKPETLPATEAMRWTADQEKEIARLQETEGLSRKSAVQKMRRAQIKAAAQARAI
jgi:hypothetical protein